MMLRLLKGFGRRLYFVVRRGAFMSIESLGKHSYSFNSIIIVYRIEEDESCSFLIFFDVLILIFTVPELLPLTFF